MVYDGDLKITNTEDIISRLRKKDDIIRNIAYYIFMKTDYFSEEFDMDRECENLLYNVVDGLKGHQSLIDLENKIISICNNTVNKYDYPKKYLVDYIGEFTVEYDLKELDKLSDDDKYVIEYNTEIYNINNRSCNDNKDLRDKALDIIINVLEKNDIEYSVTFQVTLRFIEMSII